MTDIKWLSVCEHEYPYVTWHEGVPKCVRVWMGALLHLIGFESLSGCVDMWQEGRIMGLDRLLQSMTSAWARSGSRKELPALLYSYNDLCSMYTHVYMCIRVYASGLVCYLTVNVWRCDSTCESLNDRGYEFFPGWLWIREWAYVNSWGNCKWLGVYVPICGDGHWSFTS